jgi:hypothetical protein
MTFSGFEPVVVVVVVPVVVVEPVVVVVVDPVVVVVVVEPVVVVVVLCCWAALPNCPLLFARAIEVAKPAARSARSIALSFMSG